MNSGKSLKLNTKEKGAVLLEFSFALPILMVLSFLGYNLMKMIDVNMVKRDLSRTISLSYLCSFRSGLVSDACFQEVVQSLNQTFGQKFKKMEFGVQTYRLSQDPANATLISTQRNNNCSDIDFPIQKVSSFSTPGFVSKFSPPDNNDLSSYKLFPKISTANTADYKKAREQLCLNGMITISEVRVVEPNLFNFSSTPNLNSEEYYEYGFI